MAVRSPVHLQRRRGCAAAMICLIAAPQPTGRMIQSSQTSTAAAAGHHVQPLAGRLVGSGGLAGPAPANAGRNGLKLQGDVQKYTGRISSNSSWHASLKPRNRSIVPSMAIWRSSTKFLSGSK